MILDELIDVQRRINGMIDELSLSDSPKPMPVHEGLTPIERAIFDRLALAPGRWVTASQLIVVCEATRNWKAPFTVAALWVHINRLRNKLRGVEIISAVKVGYMIREK